MLDLRSLVRHVVAVSALSLAPAGVAFATSEAATTPAPEPRVEVGPELRALALPLDEALLNELRARNWPAAAERLGRIDPATLVGNAKADWAFLNAWTLVHADRAADAWPMVPLMEGTKAPAAYVALVRGELHLGRDEWLDALKWLDQVPTTAVVYPRAVLQRAEALKELGRTQEAWAALEALAAEGRSGSEKALLALAERDGAGSPEAYPRLRKIWTDYPGTPEEAVAAKRLAAYPTKATWQEVARRAEKWMDAGDWRRAITATEGILASATDDSMDACRVLYTRGRSFYKLNELGNAVLGFGDIGTRCVKAEGDYGARGLYLVGTAEHRRHRYAESAKAFRALAASYPGHTMADDGLTRGGISLQEGGDLAGAQAMWRQALEAYPQGDTGPEAIWRLAFSLYLEGDGAQARDIASKLGALPLEVDHVHVAAGRYWAARWALYPDVANPSKASEDPAAREAAIAGWTDLIRTWPHSFYAILAWSRLQEIAPERAAELSVRPEGHDVGDLSKPWVVRLSFLEDPATMAGTSLARVGLIREAREEWRQLDMETLEGDERAWLTELRIGSGDWLLAHDELRSWLKTHPVGTLGPNEPRIVRVAYPDRYWDLVQEAAKGDRYEPRLFHALVREESNFNRQIVSFAGARGLSQLMPATAKQTAGWLGMTITMDQLEDPKTNLTIGARYLDAMHKDLGDSPYLSLAAYNAGAGRVREWLGAWGNVPTDEYVERIPFRETREYVKRVMGTWQTMRWQFDTQSGGFYDLSSYNHHARKE